MELDPYRQVLRWRFPADALPEQAILGKEIRHPLLLRQPGCYTFRFLGSNWLCQSCRW